MAERIYRVLLSAIALVIVNDVGENAPSPLVGNRPATHLALRSHQLFKLSLLGQLDQPRLLLVVVKDHLEVQQFVSIALHHVEILLPDVSFGAVGLALRNLPDYTRHVVHRLFDAVETCLGVKSDVVPGLL